MEYILALLRGKKFLIDFNIAAYVNKKDSQRSSLSHKQKLRVTYETKDGYKRKSEIF